jgi:hypothetical protein
MVPLVYVVGTNCRIVQLSNKPGDSRRCLLFVLLQQTNGDFCTIVVQECASCLVQQISHAFQPVICCLGRVQGASASGLCLVYVLQHKGAEVNKLCAY